MRRTIRHMYENHSRGMHKSGVEVSCISPQSVFAIDSLAHKTKNNLFYFKIIYNTFVHN